MLSSALTSQKTPESLPLGDVDKMQRDLNITICTMVTVQSIDADKKQVITDDKTFEFDKCVIACGATVVPAALEGDGLDLVYHVNNLVDYRQFRAAIAGKRRLALLGAGLIGCEFANDLLNAGFMVDCIALSQAPLDLLLPKTVGDALKVALANKGVNWHLEQSIKSVVKHANGVCLTLSSGDTLCVDAVLSAIGIRPVTDFARASKLAVNQGIVVNAYCETNQQDIYALGDCAEVAGWVLQYVAPLLQCSRALAQTLHGKRTAVSYQAMPIVVKTPAYPLVVTPPPGSIDGRWEIVQEEAGMVGRFLDRHDQLQGFILTNGAVKRRMEFVKALPVWL